MADRADPRPSLTPALERLLGAIVDVTPALSGLVTTDILVVSLGAAGASVASVRPLQGQAASVVIEGHRRRVELGLRPAFFLDGDAPRRLGTLCHELLHLDPRRRGALLDENRHAHRSQRDLDRAAAAMATAALQALPPTTLLCLAHDGEVRLRAWRRRPADDLARSRFTDKDVYDAVVPVVTPADRRGGWW